MSAQSTSPLRTPKGETTMTNRNFGKLDETNRIIYAPVEVTVDGAIHINPSESDYAAAGYLPIDSTKPEKLGVYFISTEYGDLAEDGSHIVRRYEHPLVPPTPPVTRYSKLKLIVAAKAAGKWDAFKQFIASACYEDEWAACQFLSSDYPQFEQAKDAIVTFGIATAEEVDAILAASVDEEVR